MGLFTTFLLLATGVFLPSFDVYSDIYFAAKLLKGGYYHNDWCKSHGYPVSPHPKFGIAMLAPVVLSWIFVAKQWYQTEKGLRMKLSTLPFLILQCYPQYRALRVIYHANWGKTSEWQKMKDAFEMEVSHLGEYHPQKMWFFQLLQMNIPLQSPSWSLCHRFTYYSWYGNLVIINVTVLWVVLRTLSSLWHFRPQWPLHHSGYQNSWKQVLAVS